MATRYINCKGLKVHKKNAGPKVIVVGSQLGARDSPVVAPVPVKLGLMV